MWRLLKIVLDKLFAMAQQFESQRLPIRDSKWFSDAQMLQFFKLCLIPVDNKEGNMQPVVWSVSFCKVLENEAEGCAKLILFTESVASVISKVVFGK